MLPIMASETKRMPYVGSKNSLQDLVEIQIASRSVAKVQDQVGTHSFGNVTTNRLEVSGNLLLHSTEPLFKRYMSMSGTSLTMKPLPPPVSEFAYSSVIDMFGLKGLSGSERIKALLELPAEKLLSVPPNIPLMPVIDGDLIRNTLDFAHVSSKEDSSELDMPGRKWCKDLLIGDCQFDVSSC